MHWFYSGAHTGVKCFFRFFSIPLFCGFSGCFLRLISGQSGPVQIIIDGFGPGFAMAWYFSVSSSTTDRSLRTRGIFPRNQQGFGARHADGRRASDRALGPALPRLGEQKGQSMKTAGRKAHHKREKTHRDSPCSTNRLVDPRGNRASGDDRAWPGARLPGGGASGIGCHP